MNGKKVILVTGVGGYWGAQVAARLIAEVEAQETPAYHVIGLDSEPPAEEIRGLDFIQADVRNPMMMNLLESEGVHTVCHLVFTESVRPSEAAFDRNVMGTMKIMGACAEARVRKVVLKSSMAVYGANPANPAFITEEHPIQGDRSYGFTRDLAEIEAFCNGFRRQVPEITLTILRFSSIIGPEADTPLTRFLKEPLAPVLMGFDPLMQVIHERDVVDALAYAIENDVPGVFNVAAEGIMPLRRLMTLAAKIPLPVFHPFAYLSADVMGSVGARVSRFMPIPLDYLRYPWVGDLTNMREQLGFVPRYTAEEALREFAGEQRMRRYVTDVSDLAYDEERLRDTIERRRRARELDEMGSTEQVEG
jgi:UDP-glucose 4-epimerase